MLLVRRSLSWTICLWLVCQTIGVAAAPLVLYHGGAASGAHDEETCNCPVAPGQACPMHRPHDSSRCQVRSASGASEAALLALAGSFGVLPQSTFPKSALDSCAFISAVSSAAISRARRPEAPPPRG